MSHARAVLLSVAALLLLAPSAIAAALPRLSAEPDRDAGGRIVDATGREVLLRGVNVNALGEYWKGVDAPPVLPFTAADADAIDAIGWNAVRLIVSWSRVEPSPGHYDERYLDRVRSTIATLAARGIYTIVDLHQDAWSATLAAPAGTVCADGTKPALGWDGAPAWATLDGGASRCYVATRELSPAVQASWAAFFADRPAADGVGIQTRYVAMLGHLARRFGRGSAVAGIDDMNEPGALDSTENRALGPFYARALRSIREGERAAGGFAHLVLVEPAVTWSLLSKGPLPAFAHDANVVYAPHLYGGSIGTRGLPRPASFATARREARVLGGAPVLTGEWGGDPDRAGPGGDGYFRLHQGLQDRYRISATLWTWKQSCGDPHDVLTQREGAASPTPPWSVYTMDCAGGSNRIAGQDRALVGELRRAYVRAAPGRLRSVSVAAGVLRVSGRDASTRDGALEAFVPGARPRVTTTGLRRASVSRTAGGWLVRAAPAAARWTLVARGGATSR